VIAALALGGLGLAIGLLLAVARLALAGKESDNATALIDAVDALLPQMQCAQCGYAGCRPYAEAAVDGEALDRCPPGGARTAAALQALLGSERGVAGIAEPKQQVARIVEPDCVGCGRCLEVCPVDAIVGARQFLHAVIAEDCTGCELCIPACPVDCIELADDPRKRLPTRWRPAAAAP